MPRVTGRREIFRSHSVTEKQEVQKTPLRASVRSPPTAGRREISRSHQDTEKHADRIHLLRRRASVRTPEFGEIDLLGDETLERTADFVFFGTDQLVDNFTIAEQH